MARAAQTELAVLGALSIEPMTGFQIRNGIQQTLGFFWSESFGQIYPTLARLEADGLVVRSGTGRTSGSVFRLTDAGAERLRALLATDVEPAPRRNGLLLRLFFGDRLGVPGSRALLEDAARQASSALAGYARERAEAQAEPPTPGRPYRLMTLSYGEHVARATAAWAQECLDLLDELERDDDAGRPERPERPGSPRDLS